MNTKIFKDLWKFSALPIVLFLILLITAGSILQSKAIRLQSEPIIIEISALDPGLIIRESGIDEELPDLSLETETSNPFANVISLLNGDKNEEAFQDLLMLKDEKGTNEFQSRYFFYSALISNRLGDKTKAIEEYKKALDFNTNYYEAAYNLGSIYLSAGRIDQSITILESTLSMAGGEKRARAYILLGKAYNRGEFYQRAEESLISAINLIPSDLKSRIELGDVYINSNQLEKAIQIFNEVLLLDEYYGDAYKGLANIKLLEGSNSEAEVLLEKTLTIIPYYDEGRKLLAKLLYDRGENDEARSHLFWIIENGTDLAGASFQLGQINYDERHFQKAEQFYRSAYDFSGKTHLESLNNLSLALKAQGKIEEAISTLETAIEVDEFYGKAYYNLGLLYLELEESQLALNSFQTVISINPKHEQAWYNIGIIHGQKGVTKSAIAAYEESLHINPSNHKCRLNLAVQYKKDNQIDKAEQQYKIVLSVNPVYASAWYNLALLLKSREDFTEAEKAYKEAINLEPEYSKYWLSLAKLYSIMGRGEDVISLLYEAIDINPNDISLRYKLAQQLHTEGRVDDSIFEYKRLISLDETYVDAWLDLAAIEYDQDSFEEAIFSYNKALQIEPENGYTKYLLAKVYYSKDEFEQAIELYLSALDSIDNNGWIWYHLGKAQLKAGLTSDADVSFNKSLSINPNLGKFVVNKIEDTDESLEILNTMIEEDPNNSNLHLQIAQFHYREGKNLEGLEALQKIIELNPDDPEIWITLAELAIKGENQLVAETALKNALELNPANGNIRFALALLIQDRGGLEESILEFNRASKTMDDPFRAFQKLGEIYYDINDYKNSIVNFIKVKESDPLDSDILIDMGKAYYRDKQYDKALAEFQRSLKLKSDYDWAYIWTGRAFAKLGKYTEAEEKYKESLEIHKGFIQGFISLGDLAKLQNKNQLAISYYQKALEVDPLHESTRKKLDRLQNN